MPKTLSEKEANHVEQKNEVNKKAAKNLKQERTEQHSSKGSFEGSQVQKCSVTFEATEKNGSLESPREQSGSGGSSISSNGSSGSSHKSSGNSNGSSKKVVVVRSAPITIGKV